MIWLWLSAATMTLTAILHAALGERRLIGPLLAERVGVLNVALARQVIRFAWHLTSLLMLLCALVILWPGVDRTLVAIIGASWLAAGLIDAVMTRGQHIGWPVLVAAGVFALIGVL